MAKLRGVRVMRSVALPVFESEMVVVALAPAATRGDQLVGLVRSALTSAWKALPWPRTACTAAAAFTRPLLWSTAG